MEQGWNDTEPDREPWSYFLIIFMIQVRIITIYKEWKKIYSVNDNLAVDKGTSIHSGWD